MCDDLWRHVPAFSSALRAFADTYADISGFNLLLLQGSNATTAASTGAATAGGGIPWAPAVAAALAQSDADVRIVLPASAAAAYAQLQLLHALGVRPAAATGHSAGEMLAALAAGGLTLRGYLVYHTQTNIQ